QRAGVSSRAKRTCNLCNCHRFLFRNALVTWEDTDPCTCSADASHRGVAMLSPEDPAWEETPQPLFSPRSAAPTVQRLVLGGHLRRLREESGMTTERAAASLRGSASKT